MQSTISSACQHLSYNVGEKTPNVSQIRHCCHYTRTIMAIFDKNSKKSLKYKTRRDAICRTEGNTSISFKHFILLQTIEPKSQEKR